MLFLLIAAGFYYPDAGAQALGRGATGVAQAGDLSAFAFNPAGLAGLHGLRVQAEGSLSFQGLDFSRAGSSTTVHDDGGAFANTLSGLSYELRDGLVVAGSLYGPPSIGRERFPANGPQRYSLIESSNLILFPGVGVGYRAASWLDLGAVAQLRYFHARQSQAIYAVGGVSGELQDLDSTVELDAVDTARIVFGLGATVRPFDGLSIGASFRPGVKVAANGTLDVTLGAVAKASGATTTGNRALLDFQLPPEARLGVRYEHKALAVLGDVVWENWGVLRSMVVTPQDVVIHQGGQDTAVGPIEIPRDWHAAWSGRLGAEYALGPATLRLGTLYETSAIPDETLQIDFVTPSRLGASVGATVRLGRFDATLGYLHFFQQDRDVRTSKVTRVDPFPAPAFIIGNGNYRSSLDVMSLQIAATL